MKFTEIGYKIRLFKKQTILMRFFNVFIFLQINSKILIKRSFYDDFLKYFRLEDLNQIVEIGCADSIILESLSKDIKYDGYDIEENYINKSKKYLNFKNFNFEKKYS